jgi:hypothetical protein
MISERLDWAPSLPLRAGFERTFAWIDAQVKARATQSDIGLAVAS